MNFKIKSFEKFNVEEFNPNNGIVFPNIQLNTNTRGLNWIEKPGEKILTNLKIEYSQYDSYQTNKMLSKNLQKPHIDDVIKGTKTVEGRLAKGEWTKIKVGDIIEFTNNDLSVKVEIIGIRTYNNFREMLKFEGIDKCLPSLATLPEMKDYEVSIDNGIKFVYNKYFSAEDQYKYNVLAFELKVC